ncbi:hypothetical protein [Huintestinicola sp.]|uniref:hypothetical protein n=1 Tax=Huintestinicola sp. TaxID=2981661 RepID=UPI003D7E00E7
MENNPLSKAETEVFELLNSLIETKEDKKLTFSIMLCCINNEDLCHKILSIPDDRHHTTISDINSRLGEFLEPLEIVE